MNKTLNYKHKFLQNLIRNYYILIEYTSYLLTILPIIANLHLSKLFTLKFAKVNYVVPATVDIVFTMHLLNKIA